MTRLTDEKYAKHKNAWLNHIASLEAALTKRNERIAFLEATITELENAAQPEPAPEAESKVEAVNLPRPNADHYEFTGETIKYELETLYRIRSKIARPHHGVKAGDTGGWVGLETRLDENAWVSGEAKASSGAHITDYAHVGDHAYIKSGASIRDHAEVGGTTLLDGDIHISEHARLVTNLHIFVSPEGWAEVRSVE